MNPHAHHATSPRALLASAWHHRRLILTLTRREIEGRYKGSAFGVLWSILTPILMVSVFTFVFGEIFQSKWAGMQSANHLDFASALFVGLLVYNIFSECIGKAPYLITNNPNYVKKIVFPLEILSIVSTLAAIFHFVTGYLVVLMLVIFSGWQLSWTVVYTPLIILPLILLLLGLTWIISALGVYLRDISQIIGPALTVLMFLSPVFYPLSSVHEKYRWLYSLNPITFVIEEARAALIHQQGPNWTHWLPYTGICCLVMMIGFVFFQKTRSGFSDVI